MKTYFYVPQLQIKINYLSLHEDRYTDLMNHVTLRVPALVAPGLIDFYELLQNRSLASRTFGGEASRVVIIAIYIIVVFII
jgi:hypothetical protein